MKSLHRLATSVVADDGTESYDLDDPRRRASGGSV